MKRFVFFAALLLLSSSAFAVDYERALSLARRTENKIFRSPPTIRWLPERSEFWYSVTTAPDTREWVRVEPETGKVTRAADAASLSLPATVRGNAAPRQSRASSEEIHLRIINRRGEPVELFWLDLEGRRQSYGRLTKDQPREQRSFVGHVWVVTDALGRVLMSFEALPGMGDVEVTAEAAPQPPREEQRRRRGASNQSPDGRWTVRFENHNALLHDGSNGETTPLTTDGTEAQPYRGPASWSPDGKAFVLLSVREAPRRKVSVVEAAPADQLQPKVRTFDYLKPGDELPRPQPVLFRLDDRRPLLIATELFPNSFTERGDVAIRWSPASDEFFFDYNQRGHQLYRIIAVNAQSGAARIVVEETARTFIDYTNKTERHWLPDSGELLWMSERDGWAHLWLYDAARGAVKQQVTRGEWVVRDIARVDEKERVVWFIASGLRAGEDPYHQHLCRVNLDGSGFRQLTEADGNHFAEFSPDGRFFIDRWSRADHPPVVELRRSADGTLVCELERADAAALLAAGWTMPERFVAKGRDGKTDIHGVLIKPSHFDPAKKYPVLEEVYAGPHGVFAPKDFGRQVRHHALAELGFIVVQADGMGTNHRGKAFHDVAWKNLQDAGFPDRIAWLRAAAATRPWLDLSRVGIHGGSAGGQTAMRALLDHADFYKAAFADCGCHDNRMDKIWWNEQWLGWPVDGSYMRASNVVDAHKLRGALMLSVGALDSNVDPASTFQVVDALQKAGKDFELLVMPGSNHGAAESPWASRRRMEFFVRHLQPAAP